MAETLDPVTFPLWGSRLIEASAGTGKTWTIAALYLRLVLGHGGAEAGFGRPLLPGEILVMTFTRAATRELSERIRSRLLEAARCFRGEAGPDPRDALMATLLADHAIGPAREAAAWRLGAAAECMDDAAVHTIDAWCQRMLREHAFDSGSLFDEELNANEQAMQIEAAQDYWRQQLYPLAGAALDTALGVWKSVEALTADARALLSEALPAGAGEGELGALIEQLTARRGARLAELKHGWAAQARAMQTWLDRQTAGPGCPFNRSKLATRHYTAWLDALAAWAEGDSAEPPAVKRGRTRLTPAGLHDALLAGAAPVELPASFEAFEQLMAALDELASFAVELRAHAAARIARRLAALKAEAGRYGFADLLTRLDDALNPARNGAAAERLRARIVAQYPAALIDEFQDTSPVQSRIFDRLYRLAANDRATALLLIGDPKQAIYGFRGADIQSYLAARRATIGRHYMLGTNHRSTQALVRAVNHVFMHAESRLGEGAFMFRLSAVPAPDDALPFVPVAARGRAERFVSASGPEPALRLALDAGPADAETSRGDFAAHCAERIATLLNDEHAGFDSADGGFERLRPADIAVLVRTGTQAAAVRRAMRRRGVASVYLSDRVSVFASAEARDLVHWLRAVAAPLNVRLARAALATRTVGLSVDELLRLADDDEAFDARSELLRQLHGVWQQQGVLAMLRQTLYRLDLPARWLGGAQAEASADGERRLTNVLHLAELLQAASAQQGGEEALIRWLSMRIDEGDAAGGDEQIVRLESDADLVKVVTVHQSKGLEYALVFLPFASGFRAVDTKRTPFVTPADAEGRRTLVLEPTRAQLIEADRDRQREDLRLLYVALTRARHALWVGVAALTSGPSKAASFHRSGIGHLFGGGGATPSEALAALIGAVVAPCDDIVLEAAGDAGRCSFLRPRAPPPVLREVQPYAASFERRWTIGSFSALVRSLGAPTAWASSVAAVRDDEGGAGADLVAPPVAASARRAEAADDASPWHRFPRGALPGNFLHDQLEWLAGAGFDLDASAGLREQLRRRCERQGWGHRAGDVVGWLGRVVSTTLPPVGAALVNLRAPLPEMEFWFPSDGLASAEVDALCRLHLLGGRARPALPERDLRGMLMGFADLVFEHGGRYWVLDYKSNYLGAGDADYGAGALEAAVAAHRYEVQAALYLLALHRLLKSRLGAAYEPARQLGGAVCFFLRGIGNPTRGCCHIAPSIPLLEALDALLGRRTESAR